MRDPPLAGGPGKIAPFAPHPPLWAVLSEYNEYSDLNTVTKSRPFLFQVKRTWPHHRFAHQQHVDVGM